MSRPGQVRTLGQVLADYTRSAVRGPALSDSIVGPAWRKAYKQAGRPNGILSAEEGYQLARLHERALRDEMRRVCSRFGAPQLFFAVRFWTPASIGNFGLNFGEEDRPEEATLMTAALRRIAANAALLYGRPAPDRYATLSGGEVPLGQEKRFARTFVALMVLSHKYATLAWAIRAVTAMGYRVYVDEDGMRPLGEDDEEQDLLTFSYDNRRHSSYDLLIRLGEFEGRTAPIIQPYKEPGRGELGERSALFMATYHAEPGKPSGYAVRGELLEPVENLLLELERLHPGSAVAAWGMGFRDFIALLGGFGLMLKDRMTDDWIFEATPDAKDQTMDWHMFLSATVPFFAPEVEGDGEGTLLDYARDYARRKGFDLEALDLRSARDRFLDLAISTGKHEVDDDSGDPAGISLGDGRYSYLLHKFGDSYVADLFHADHWLNRPLDMLHNRMRGTAGDLKGGRVEDRVWDYMGNSEKIEPVEALRNTSIRAAGKKEVYNDLDCPLRIGDVLILAEVKGKYMARAPEAFAHPDIVRRRWKENRKFLRKIDRTAELVALRKEDDTFRVGLEGVRFILPVVVRPYPEWVPDLADEHWLRKPSRPDVGVPRILTPPELKEFLEGTPADGIANLPGGFVVDLEDA